MNKLNINQWALEDRPREKMASLGAETLSDAELLAILIGSGSPQESAVDLMKRVLNDCKNNLNTLGKKSVQELCEYNGIGEAKAITIIELPWAYTTGANSLYDVPTGWDSNLTISEANTYGTLVPSDTSGYELGGRYIEGKNYAKLPPMHINQAEAVFSFDFAAFTWSRFAQPPYNAYTWKDADKLYAVIHTAESEETVPLLDGESFVEPDTLGLVTYNVDLSNYVDKIVQVEVVFEVNAYDVYVVMENFKAEGKDLPPVSIRGINSEAIEGKAFDLQGRRASEATGLMIKNGKVILVK